MTNGDQNPYENIPTPSEAAEDELYKLKKPEGPPLVSDEIADYIRDNMPTEDDAEWERLAHDSQNDNRLARLLIEREQFIHRRYHPSYEDLSDDEFKAGLTELDIKINERKQELEERRL